jgi:hypothetical protein
MMTSHASLAESGVDFSRYPHRAQFTGDNFDAPTIVVWLEGFTFDADCLESVLNMLDRDGHALIMCRTADDLARAVAILSVLNSTAIGDMQ